MDPVLAIDVGGTKLAAGLVDADGRVLLRDVVPVAGADGDAESLWQRLLGLCERVVGEAAPSGVGVGSGGPMAWPSGEISPLNILAWRDFPLRARLAERWPGVPVRVHNDAIAVAAAEHWRGAGRGTQQMMGMVCSTGVGGGIVLAGRIVDGTSGNAGHIGHVVVEPDGPVCACGGQGCLEAVARGPAVAAWARERGWRAQETRLERLTARDVADDARGGDAVALAAFARAGHALGVGIASAVALLDLQLVALGGGLAQAGALLFDPLQEAFHHHARLGFTQQARVVPAALGQDAGLVGAAALVLAGDRYWTGG